MPTREEARRQRLENDYRQMLNIRSGIVGWEPIRGIEPYVEQYKLTINVCTIIARDPQYRDTHTVLLELPTAYPFDAAPVALMQTRPPPFHPNWYTDGRWCKGTWLPSEGLADYVLRMIRTLQFDAEITNEASPANREANDWYVHRKGSRLFPTDRQILPDPTKARILIKESPRKAFRINNIT